MRNVSRQERKHVVGEGRRKGGGGKEKKEKEREGKGREGKGREGRGHATGKHYIQLPEPAVHWYFAMPNVLID